ncbi:nuclear pore complex protein Nup160 homolog [Anopheles nili]|uniref:nuclear pore complex protein Nup160 homolog n=1 Tax=Anopheles nili TaxID=185578 RepID=UPI00237BE5B0|nr:nuclear pore complex protein Nup160 homolog [Anopheles nili]
MTVRYREVPLLQQCLVRNKRKSITVSSGGYHAMLVDSKTSDISGMFEFDNTFKNAPFKNRFLYWRTCRETIYLTETCVDRNDVCHELKITFEGCPIMAVECFKPINCLGLMIIVTTTSIHWIPLSMPVKIDQQSNGEQDSILYKLNEHMLADPSHCYTFITDIGQVLPVAATIIHYPAQYSSKIAVACASSLHLFSMRMEGDKMNVNVLELDHNPLTLSKLIHTIADSWRRKTHVSQVVAMSFGISSAEDESYLYTLHRDGTLRVWLSSSGRFLAAEHLSKYTQGSETEFHTCILRCSQTFIALYFSFQTFSEFIILYPKSCTDSGNTGVVSVTLQNVSTIMAPNYDLIDFKLCDESLWSLWCNAESETQTLVYELAPKDNSVPQRNAWSPVILENTNDKVNLTLESCTDFREVYSNHIFNSGLFPDKVIKKTLTMFNRNLASVAGNSATGNMVRLKRYVLTCIENQMHQQSAAIRGKDLLEDEHLLEISNELWEKFYLYCVQYRYELSKPVGLFLVERQCNEKSYFTVGIVRKKYISFFRTCDHLEACFFAHMCHDYDANSHYCASDNDLFAENYELMLLVIFLGELEKNLSFEQKHDIDAYIRQRCENDKKEHTSLFIEAIQNQFFHQHKLVAFLQRITNLPHCIEILLQCLKPVNREEYLKLWQEETQMFSVFSGNELASEIALTAAKQSINVRYLLLRNLLLLQLVVQRHCNLHYDVINAIQSSLGPDTENMLRCYYTINWIACTRLDIDWTKTNRISASFPLHLRTSMSLLQAFATSRMNEEISSLIKSLPNVSQTCYSAMTLSLAQKTNLIISYICPSSDDFLFGEWLSNNDLHLHIDAYVRLLSNWCEWNSCSRNFIRAKSYLALGDTFKALDLFPLSLKGIQTERVLQKFLRHSEKDRTYISPYATITTFYLRLIRLFDVYGAQDGVMKLVHSGIDSTIQPKQEAMFQSIEFSCHMELGHYEEAYNTLIKNCEPARKKDCLRQLIYVLFSVRRLDILLDLPYYGLEEEFANIVTMNARVSDIVDCMQYDFLYAFYVNKMNLKKAAINSYEHGMRNFLECSSFTHLNKYYGCLMNCLNALAIIKKSHAWIIRPIKEVVEQSINNAGENKIEIIDIKQIEEQLITTHCALQLSMNSDGFKLVTSLEPMNLISLLLKRKLYHLALKLAHSRMKSMVPAIYEHLVSSCITVSVNAAPATNNQAPVGVLNGLSWLNDSCVSEVATISNNSSTAWNFLRHMMDLEQGELAKDVHLAVLNRLLSRNAHIPTWLKHWCSEHVPIQMIRTYLCHGRLEEAYEHIVELFRNRFFSAGRFKHNTLFPLSVCEYLLYELNQLSQYSQEKDHIEQYLRIIEIAS